MLASLSGMRNSQREVSYNGKVMGPGLDKLSLGDLNTYPTGH